MQTVTLSRSPPIGHRHGAHGRGASWPSSSSVCFRRYRQAVWRVQMPLAARRVDSPRPSRRSTTALFSGDRPRRNTPGPTTRASVLFALRRAVSHWRSVFPALAWLRSFARNCLRSAELMAVVALRNAADAFAFAARLGVKYRHPHGRGRALQDEAFAPRGRRIHGPARLCCYSPPLGLFIEQRRRLAHEVGPELLAVGQDRRRMKDR